MINTILSGNESKLLENLIISHGNIVTFEDIAKEFKNVSYPDVKNRVVKLVKNGWLVRIKKGVYSIEGVESRGISSLSFYKIAQIINKDSYISCEAALQYHGMFDQMLQVITSITTVQSRYKELQGLKYMYIQTGENEYYGFEKTKISKSEFANIAFVEKALLDMLAFKKSLYTIDLILEKLIEHQHDFNYERFNEFISKQKISVQRIVGFLFDKAGIDSIFIEELLKSKKGYSMMSEDSKQFNAKWRLYYSELKTNED